MRIRALQILPDLTPYGLERVVASLATLASADRFQTAVACLYDALPGGLTGTLRRQGVAVYHLGKKRGFDPSMYSRIDAVIRGFRPHIVHSHNYVLRYSLAPSLLRRVPVLVHTVHNVAEREVERAGRWLHHVAFRAGVCPVAIGEVVARSCERVYRLGRLEVIPNGIPVAAYARRDGRAWREAQGYAERDLLIVCVARFFEQKNHAALLEAFAGCVSSHPHARLLLAGDGELRAEAEARVARLGLAARVDFLGRRDDVPDMLAATDLFVLPSLWEGTPLSVMEAMAAGKALVATRVGGVTDLVEDGVSGLLVSPGDAVALRGVIDRLLGDPELRGALGAAARARAQARFEERSMVRRYESLYERLLAKAGSQGRRLAA